MTPSVIRFPETRSIEYRLRIQTGAQAERLRVQLMAPLWAGGLADGSPVRLAAEPTLEGPGTLEEFREASSRSTGDECIRGYRVTWGMAVLALPAETTSTLVARYDTGRAAPWRGTDLRVRFVVGGIAGGPRRVDVLPPKPALRGKTGVRFRLRFEPAQPEAGERVRILGRTYRALAGETIRVGAARTGYVAPGQDFFEGPSFPESFGRPWRLGTARVDAAGRFSLPGFVASARRFYAVWTRYRTTRRDFVSDRSCEAMVWVDS